MVVLDAAGRAGGMEPNNAAGQGTLTSAEKASVG
jgi:hypothetical protein